MLNMGLGLYWQNRHTGRDMFRLFFYFSFKHRGRWHYILKWKLAQSSLRSVASYRKSQLCATSSCGSRNWLWIQFLHKLLWKRYVYSLTAPGDHLLSPYGKQKHPNKEVWISKKVYSYESQCHFCVNSNMESAMTKI